MRPAADDRLRDKLLELEMRRRIYERIRRVPGIHLRRLSRELCASLGTVEHHLRVLQRQGLVVSHHGGRRRSFYDAAHVEARDVQILHALRHRMQRRILVHLLAEPQASFGDLAAGLGLTESTASYHVQHLARAGLVSCRRVGRFKLYEVADAARLGRILEIYGATFRGLVPPGGRPGPQPLQAAPNGSPEHVWHGIDLDGSVFGGLIQRIPPGPSSRTSNRSSASNAAAVSRAARRP